MTGPSSVEPRPVLAPPIFPGRRQPSIVGRNELNYRVRNGNGWTLVLISTNSIVNRVDPDNKPYYMTLLFTCQALFIVPCVPSPEGLVTRTGFEPMLTA